MRSTNKRLQAALQEYAKVVCNIIDDNRYIVDRPYLGIMYVWLSTTPSVHTYYTAKHNHGSFCCWSLPTTALNPIYSVACNYMHNVYINCRVASRAAVIPW